MDTQASCGRNRSGDHHNVGETIAEQQRCRLLEQVYVHDVYERISSDFENDHYQPWPIVKQFLNDLEPGSIVADIGCGNGHYMNVNPSVVVFGLDRCHKLLSSAQERSSGLCCRADCLKVPYRDNSFDAVICIGVIHHLVSSKRQVMALNEIARVLRPGGKLLLNVWAWEQPKRKFDGQSLLIPRVSTKCDKKDEKARKSETPLFASIRTWVKHVQVMTGTISLFSRRNLEYKNSIDSVLLHNNDFSICNETTCSQHFLEIPEEFQVREFPGSSLFAISKPLKQTQERSLGIGQRKQCRFHTTSATQSRDDRFYYVFKNGEIAKLVNDYAPALSLKTCSYNSGHWCATLTKQS